MRNTSTFPCIMAIVSTFTIFFYLSHICFQSFFNKYNRFLHFHMILAAPFVNYFIFLFFKVIIFIACYFKDSLNFFIQSLPLCISCLLSMLLNDDIVDIEKWYIVTNEMTSSINFLPFVELEEPFHYHKYSADI